jgi:hypothetical protein
MYRCVTRRIAARFVFIIGFLLMILGITLLIGSLMTISRVTMITSFLLIFLGTICAFFATKLNWRSLYLFFAALFVQTGLFLFLYAMHIIPAKLSQTWPMLSVFSGIALVISGWHRYGIPKINYIVTSVAFILLGITLMIFSFDLVSFSLAQFVRNWWRLLLVLAGLMLVLFAIGTRNRGE